MPPIYDLECSGDDCNYEKNDALYKSHKAFQEADKTCPECGDTLEKKLPKINIGGTAKHSSREPDFPPIGLGIEIGIGPCPNIEKCKKYNQKKNKNKLEQAKKMHVN